MKATITDVAKEAGVSMKTVSRVLNNEPNVAQATREKVRDVARRLKYSPSLAARGLAGSRSYFIALLYDDPSPSYLTRLQRGAVEACRANGYHLALEPLSMSLCDPAEIDLKLSRLSVDGVILTPPLSEFEPVRQSLIRLGMAFSLITPQAIGDDFCVGMDERGAAEAMTEHLIELGHTDIGFIYGPRHHAASELRFDGFKAVLARHNIPLRQDRIGYGDFSWRSGVREGAELLSKPNNRPTAIFASNDDMAVGAINAAMELGLNVPDDLSVCGFDNTQIAEMVWPPLTTIAQPIRDMGRLAAQALIDRKTGAPSPVRHLDYVLMSRRSTAPLSVES